MKKEWAKLLLLAALLILAGTAVWLASDYAASVGDNGATVAAGSKKIAPLEEKAAGSLEEAWNHPPVWALPESGGLLFTPRRFLYFLATGKVELSGPDTKIDGIPLDWLLHHGLDASDPDIAHEDPDGDGFDNLTEYQAGTDPSDPKSHPSYALLLRVQSFQSRPFPLTFASVNNLGGENVFQVNTPKGRRMTNNVKIGDTFEGFKVIAYRPKQGPKKIGNMEVVADISELELQKEATGETVILIMEEEQNQPMVSASILLLLKGFYNHPVSVQQGSDFTIDATPSPDIPPEKLHFKLLSVDASGAKIAADGKPPISIPTLSPAEIQRFTPASSDQPPKQ